MNLHTYFMYAAVTSPIVLAIVFLSFAIKSWFDKRTFLTNTAVAMAMQAQLMDDLIGDDGKKDFDAHVASAPGMHTLN